MSSWKPYLFVVVVVNPSYCLTSGAVVIKGVNKYFFGNSLARLMRHDFVICFYWKHLIISCLCWNCTVSFISEESLMLSLRWKYLGFWIPNNGKKMFYVSNKREAKVTDAIFIVIFENVTQVYWYRIFYRELVAEIRFRFSFILADAMKEMFLLCIIVANIWLTCRTG